MLLCCMCCLRTCRCVRSTGMRCRERLAWPPAEQARGVDARGFCPTLRDERTHVSWPQRAASAMRLCALRSRAARMPGQAVL